MLSLPGASFEPANFIQPPRYMAPLPGGAWPSQSLNAFMPVVSVSMAMQPSESSLTGGTQSAGMEWIRSTPGDSARPTCRLRMESLLPSRLEARRVRPS